MKFKIFSIFLCLIIISLISLTITLNVPTFHLDGAFQTASTLFRLDSGQYPGKDFYPYLGIGPVLILYPLFKFTGSDLAASQFSAHFLTMLFAWGSVSVIIFFLLRKKTFISSLCLGIIAFLGMIAISRLFGEELGTSPGNSLRPLRYSAPYLLGIISYLIITTPLPHYLKKYLTGIATGIFMLWSNDYALPTVGIFTLFFYVYFYKTSKKNWLKESFIFSIVLMLTWVVLLFIITSGHPVQLLKYNFIDVASDQWWYFGPYEDRIFHHTDLAKLIQPRIIFAFATLLVTFIFSFKTKKIELIILSLIGFTLFSGGSVASIGGHFEIAYFHGFYYWSLLVATISIINAIYYRVSLSIKTNVNIIFFPTLILVLLTLSSFTSYTYYRDLNNIKNNKNYFYVDELGGYLNNKWKDYIEFIKNNKNKNVIEEYWGLFGSLNKNFSSWPVDSVIHALGAVREISKKSLDDAEYLITSKFDTSPYWQPWSVSQNYWFYETIFAEWQPFIYSPKTIVWKKLPSKRSLKNIACTITKDKTAFILDTDKEDMYSVKLHYSITANGRYLFMVQNNLSFAVDSVGYVSLDPKSNYVSIPVVLKGYGNEIFKTKFIGIADGKIHIKSCEATRFIPGIDDKYISSVLNLTGYSFSS